MSAESTEIDLSREKSRFAAHVPESGDNAPTKVWRRDLDQMEAGGETTLDFKGEQKLVVYVETRPDRPDDVRRKKVP